jgi:hypothetical protein
MSLRIVGWPGAGRQGDNMQARPPQSQHERVPAPDGPALRPGETRPEDVRAWRRDRIALCIGTLLRDPAVAQSVARGVHARKTQGTGDKEERATHLLVACPCDLFDDFIARRSRMAALRRQRP